MELSREEMSRLRVQHAKNTKRDAFATFAINVGGIKAISKIAPDNLSKPDRKRIEEIKERINDHYDDEGDMW